MPMYYTSFEFVSLTTLTHIVFNLILSWRLETSALALMHFAGIYSPLFGGFCLEYTGGGGG